MSPNVFCWNDSVHRGSFKISAVNLNGKPDRLYPISKVFQHFETEQIKNREKHGKTNLFFGLAQESSFSRTPEKRKRNKTKKKQKHSSKKQKTSLKVLKSIQFTIEKPLKNHRKPLKNRKKKTTKNNHRKLCAKTPTMNFLSASIATRLERAPLLEPTKV
jgi:hypothetical protein